MFSQSLLNRAYRRMSTLVFAALVGTAGLFNSDVSAQAYDFDASWYDAGAQYLKIGVEERGVHQLTGADVAAAGVAIGAIDPTTLKIFEDGVEIPIWFEGDDATFDPTDKIQFVGHPNTGEDEAEWAYFPTHTSVAQTPNDDLQSSSQFSLFTPTNYYWLTWSGGPGLRYVDTPTTPDGGAQTITRVTQSFQHELNFTYHAGDSSDNGHPYYTHGEGYYWHTFSQNSIRRDSVITSAIVAEFPSDPSVMVNFEVRIAAGSAAHHNVILKVRMNDGGSGVYVPVDEADWTGYEYRTLTASIPSNEVFRFRGQVYYEVVSDNQFYDGVTPNLVFTDWFRVTTSRNLTQYGRQIMFPSRGGGNYAYATNGWDPGEMMVLDPTTGRRFFGPVSGSGDFVFGDNGNATSEYWASAPDSVLTPVSFEQDQSSDLANAANAYDYIIITGSSMRSRAEDLADFHAARNGYSVLVANIEDVFDQFDYGRTTPIAIRRFLQETQAWSSPARFALLWGDARYVDPNVLLEPWEVPSYGFSTSDNWFVQGLNGKADLNEFMALGRIPVRTQTDANIFLAKMADYYDAPFDDWQHRAYFLTGGTGSEQTAFQNASINWASFAAQPPAGADTSYFFKTNDTILDTSLRDSIRVALRRGGAIVSYFGHSSSQTWEIVTDPASEFDNLGRLPLVLSYGCRTGAFGQGIDPEEDLRSLAEELLIDAESGAIGHWGSTELGTISDSRFLGDLIFEDIYSDTTRVLGEAIRTTKNDFFASRSSYWGIRHMLQYNLIGDPGVRLAIPDKPDFHITEALSTFEPLIPLTADSTVFVNLDLRNRGYYSSDSLTVSVHHTAPDGSERTYDTRIEAFGVADTLALPIPIRDIAGLHHYDVTVDPLNEYDEMREDNNMVSLSHLVFSNGLTVVAPETYGVTDQTPLMRVSIASQVGIGNVPVHFQLDTVPTFDSASLRTRDATLANAYADWQITNPIGNDQVYFWRATIDDPNDPDANWTTSTFSVSNEHEGDFTFMQQDVQWLDNRENIRLEWTEAGWDFVPFTVSVFANSDRAGQTNLRGVIQVNGNNYVENGAGFGMVVLDGDQGGVKDVVQAITYSNPFGADPAQQIASLQAAVAEIEEGDYFFVRTRHLSNGSGPDIPQEVKDAFSSIGLAAIDTLTYDHLWLAKGRVGDPSYREEWVVAPQEDEIPDISWTQKLSFPYPEGQTTSPSIGPSQAWTTFESDFSLPGTGSSILFDVLSEDGDVLMEDVNASSSVDISSISAAEHPYLRVRSTLSDLDQTGTPQLDNWRVGFVPVADLVVDASASDFPDDAFQEGSTNTSTIAIRNLSEFASTSTDIQAQYTDPENNTESISSQNVGVLQPGEVKTTTFDLPSLANVGTNLFFAQATQSNVSERIIYNNVLLRPFDVFADNTRPVMEVTVDGLLLDNAPGAVLDLQSADLPFVSAQPSIEVIVNDENPYLQLDDPSTFQVALDRVPLSPEQFTFTPATAELNEARILFEPDLTGVDTVHTFTVRAFDSTGNLALVDPTAEDSTLYQVHFRVQTALAVESIYPYPNPMSRRTRLMFRMGGESASLVDEFRIRLYTISGRLIREFDLIRNPELLERGSLQIGWNSVPWDGTDEDGDSVASGVYFYKVFLTDSDGQEHIVNNEDNIDRIAVIR